MIQRYLAKYINNPAKLTRMAYPQHLVGISAGEEAEVEEYETDDETDDESLRIQELRSQLLEDKIRKQREAEEKRAAEEAIKRAAEEEKRAAEVAEKIELRIANLGRLKKMLLDKFTSHVMFAKNGGPDYFRDNMFILSKLSNILFDNEKTTVANFGFTIPNEIFIREMIQEKNDVDCKYAAEQIELTEKRIGKNQKNIELIKKELSPKMDMSDPMVLTKIHKMGQFENQLSFYEDKLQEMRQNLENLQSLDIDAEVEKFNVFIDQTVNFEAPRGSKRTWGQHSAD